MSWLRSSPLRQSISRGNSAPTNKISTECDPSACYDSFCKHWQQAYDVILKAEVSRFIFKYLIRFLIYMQYAGVHLF